MLFSGKRRTAAALLACLLSIHAGIASAATVARKAGESVVTLITGDRVHLTQTAEGPAVVMIEPGPGREHVGFVRTSTNERGKEQLMVLPTDALPLVRAGRLDRALFNVTELVREGFDDQRQPTLPLIVTQARGASASAFSAMPAGTRVKRSLPSVGGRAVVSEKRSAAALWQWLTNGRAGTRPAAAAKGAASLPAEIQKVWLDARAHPVLDESAPQIGVPAARQVGLTGRGVRVAILDTGIKADHPDFAGVVAEARDFTDTRPDAGDDIGHGTHVAGIVAGSGAASGGRYVGVAPQATLLIGKVCVPEGCPFSAIIAAMEWAAPTARIINMSLSGAATDGSDVLSQALNTLAAQHGTLFVVAAGNKGEAQSVGTPGTADAALTVASVTKQNAMSAFSSRGPRAVDFALKPDAAAPGSGIVAARANGTPVGDTDPIDDHYARLSGTSMATPHMAGAAALLAQAHPDWRAAELKSALMSTSLPIADATIYDQGVGRVDLVRAVSQPVIASQASLSFDRLLTPYSSRPAVSRTITYRNGGAAAVTLNLAVSVTDAQGAPAPAGLFTVRPSQLTVAAHGTADAIVTLNPAMAVPALYGGRLIATAGSTVVPIALGVFAEPESFNLTLQVTHRLPTPDDITVFLVNLETGATSLFGADDFENGRAVLRLPKGRYDVLAQEMSSDDGPQAVTLFAEPDIALEADTTVALDAGRALPVTATVDRPAAIELYGFSILSTFDAGAGFARLSVNSHADMMPFAVPSRRSTTHSLAFEFQPTLTPTKLGAGADPVIYHLAFANDGGIPERLDFRARDRDLATVRARYHVQGAPALGLRGNTAFYAKPGLSSGSLLSSRLPVPSNRTELYTAGPGVRWTHVFQLNGPRVPGQPRTSQRIEANREYRRGRTYGEAWARAPIGPAFGVGPGWGVTRMSEGFIALVSLFSDSTAGHFSDREGSGATGSTTLSRDGIVLGTNSLPGRAFFIIPPEAGRYTLNTTATRTVPWSVLGTRIDVSWTFQDPGGDEPPPAPLQVVRVGGDVDANGRAPAGRLFALPLHVERQPGAPDARVADLALDVSFDDGNTWAPARVFRSGDRGVAMIQHPPRDGFVSLRARATDALGNAVTQTVIRAYVIAVMP
jgi:subtilisin family serine protease